MDRFKIFPSFGIARLGGSTTGFYIGPETPGSLGSEMDATGNEQELTKFKDQNLIKRRGARFRIYELDAASNSYLPADMSQVTVTWTVHLANKKAAVKRPRVPLTLPPAIPLAQAANWQDSFIDGGEQTISGKLKGNVQFDKGKFQGQPIFIGELKTDRQGNVIILGGHGRSDSFKSPKPSLTGFYTTDGWFDDTADGYVKAEVKLNDGTSVQASPAWVVVTPPDFAPLVNGVVTLYDVMFQVAVDKGLLSEHDNPSFTWDILPIIQRFKGLQWVNTDPQFMKVSATDAQLAALQQADRDTVRSNILGISEVLRSREGPIVPYQLIPFQLNLLDKWVTGTFQNDFAAHPAPPSGVADQLNKLILDSGVGQGFFPGIEGGIIIKRPDIYLEPFRLDPAKIQPGDITGLMALPWQADFMDCNTNWWPSQRPDEVLRNGSFEPWAQGVGSMQEMVDKFNQLGFVVPSGERMVEQERN